MTPHLAQNITNRRSAIDGRTTRHPGYAVSGRVRKRIEEVFGWTKAAAGFRKTRHRGLARVGWMFTLTATAYNLVRLPKLVGLRRSHARNLPELGKNRQNQHKSLLRHGLQQLEREPYMAAKQNGSRALRFSASC